jgi:hypothetical protein
MKQYLSKLEAKKFSRWLDSLRKFDALLPAYKSRTFTPDNVGDYAKGEKFYKPSGQLAFGYEISGNRIETRIFIDTEDILI